MSSVIIIHRPSAATRAFVNTLGSNVQSPTIAHMIEVASKPELTECEANWLKHQIAKYVTEVAPA